MEQERLDNRLRRVLEIHFDPQLGSPYWLARAAELGIDPLADIRTIGDLRRFGPMDEAALRNRPMEDFVPKRFWQDRSGWVVSETAGTTGKPKTTVFLKAEFQAAFVRPFETAARFRNFPRSANWLWVGPGGPHMIGKAARACAEALGSPDPFSIDFDPRWVKKFAPDTIAFQRYLEHVIDQALRTIRIQTVQVLFSTPKVLIRLMEQMTATERERISGVHFGGMELEEETFRRIAAAFPRAVFISGYGNSLFGMCPEFTGRYPFDHYPVGDRLIFQIVAPDDRLTPAEKLAHPLGPGDTGQIVFTRLDESGLIINHFERDQGTLLAPGEAHRRMDCCGHGIRNPGPLPLKEIDIRVATGLY